MRGSRVPTHAGVIWSSGLQWHLRAPFRQAIGEPQVQNSAASNSASYLLSPELDLMLVFYVDDFKMAGAKANLKKAWDGVNQVLDMDPPAVFGR